MFSSYELIGWWFNLCEPLTFQTNLILHISLFVMGLYTDILLGRRKGYIILATGLGISRVSKGRWLKTKVLRCLMSLGRLSRNLQYLE